MHLGVTVPNFKAVTTHGDIQFYDWLGYSWCVLFSHPADFMPVDTAELACFAVRAREFEKRGVKLLAHSCDALNTHQEWVNDIKLNCLNMQGYFPYPIISDESRELAVQLDILDDKNKDNINTGTTVRSIYIISPDKKLRLSMMYPASTGRNVNEILRVIDSLQLTDRLKVVATPVNWTPGANVMILPSVPEEDIPRLFPRGVERICMPSGKRYVRITNDY